MEGSAGFPPPSCRSLDLTLFPPFLPSFSALQSLRTLNDQISDFLVHKARALEEDEQRAFLPGESSTLRRSMSLMTQLLMDAQVSPLPSAGPVDLVRGSPSPSQHPGSWTGMLVLGSEVDPTGTLRLLRFNFGMVCSFVPPWLAHVLLERRRRAICFLGLQAWGVVSSNHSLWKGREGKGHVLTCGR